RIQIRGDHIRGPDRDQVLAIGKPPAAKVDTAFGGGPEMLVHGQLVPSRPLRRQNVLAPAFLPGHRRIIPIPVEDLSTLQTTYPPVRLTRLYLVAAVHKELVFFFHSRQELLVDAVALGLRQQFYHDGEKWWLRTTQVIRPVAIGDMTI